LQSLLASKPQPGGPADAFQQKTANWQQRLTELEQQLETLHKQVAKTQARLRALGASGLPQARKADRMQREVVRQKRRIIQLRRTRPAPASRSGLPHSAPEKTKPHR